MANSLTLSITNRYAERRGDSWKLLRSTYVRDEDFIFVLEK